MNYALKAELKVVPSACSSTTGLNTQEEVLSDQFTRQLIDSGYRHATIAELIGYCGSVWETWEPETLLYALGSYEIETWNHGSDFHACFHELDLEKRSADAWRHAGCRCPGHRRLHRPFVRKDERHGFFEVCTSQFGHGYHGRRALLIAKA